MTLSNSLQLQVCLCQEVPGRILALPGAQPIPALSSFILHCHCSHHRNSGAVAHPRVQLEISWIFLEKHLEGRLCWGVAGSSQVAGGGIAIAIVTWETERYRHARAAALSLFSGVGWLSLASSPGEESQRRAQKYPLVHAPSLAQATPQQRATMAHQVSLEVYKRLRSKWNGL